MNRRDAIVLLSLILLLTFSVSGCSQNLNTNKNSKSDNEKNSDDELIIEIGNNQVVIGLALGTLAEERWVNEKLYFEKEAAKYGAKVITKDANMDEKLQNKQIKELIERNVDVLVIVAVNDETANECVKAAKCEDIPVLAYSRMINNADLDVFIGFDAVGIGETLAQAAVESVPKGHYFIINGSHTDSNAKEQQEGYFNVLIPYITTGDIIVSHEVWCDNWSPEKAYIATKKGLEKYKNKVDAVIVSNDGMAGGVIDALKEQGLEKKVFVTGTDGDLSALKRITQEIQTVTLLYPQKEFAEEGARAAISLANDLVPADATGRRFNGLKDIPTIFARTVLVTKENLDETVIETGIKSYDEIYADMPKGDYGK